MSLFHCINIQIQCSKIHANNIWFSQHKPDLSTSVILLLAELTLHFFVERLACVD